MSAVLTRVPFAGGELLAVRGATPRETLIAMKPIATRLSLDWRSQLRRLSAHPTIGTRIVGLTMQVGGQAREVSALPLSLLPLWLATISTGRIRDKTVRDLIVRFQTEAADVLYAHFFGRAAAPAAPGIATAAAPAGITAATIGGIAKSVVGRALADHLSPLHVDLAEQRGAIAALAARLDRLLEGVGARGSERAAAPAGVFNSALMLLIELGWPQAGRSAIAASVSVRLTQFCAEHGFPTRVTRESGIRLFSVDAFAAWRAHGGDAYLEGCRARMTGRAA